MKIYLFIAAIQFSTVSLNAQWYAQTSNTTNTLRSVQFVNKSTGFACGFEVVLKTTDCGTTWNASFLEGYHRSVFFVDENSGWISGDNGKVYKTNNAGVNWTLVPTGVNYALNQISFIDNNTGIAIGSHRTILKTTNSGASWQNINNVFSELDFHAAKVLNVNHYIVTGTESSIYISSDAGASWDTLSLGMPNPLVTVEFMNENTGWVSGCCGMFMKTTNAGNSWSSETYVTPGFTINSMKFINENFGWLTGDAGYILRTTNSGTSWDSLNSGTTRGLYGISFLNKDTGFIVGYNGLILKTINGGGEGFPLNVKNISSDIPDRFSLDQNYPNPFNPTTKIKFTLSKDAVVKLKIFDVKGNEAGVFVNTFLRKGIYETEINASHLTSGIYFYALEAGGVSISRKMLLIK